MFCEDCKFSADYGESVQYIKCEKKRKHVEKKQPGCKEFEESMSNTYNEISSKSISMLLEKYKDRVKEVEEFAKRLSTETVLSYNDSSFLAAYIQNKSGDIATAKRIYAVDGYGALMQYVKLLQADIVY